MRIDPFGWQRPLWFSRRSKPHDEEQVEVYVEHNRADEQDKDEHKGNYVHLQYSERCMIVSTRVVFVGSEGSSDPYSIEGSK
jgi:hypothetical protein